MLDAILTMIGYYIVILAAAMIVIVIGIQVFKMLSGRRQGELHEPTGPSAGMPDRSEELTAAAIATVTAFAGSGQRGSVSAWVLFDTDARSSWKIASRSRRISFKGG